MFPEPLFHIFGQPVTFYALAYYCLGFLPGLPIGLRMGRERGFLRSVALDGWVICVILVLVAWHPALPRRWSLAGIGVVLAIMGLRALLTPSIRARPMEAMDLLIPGLLLYHVIARLGCFAAGCCHGRPAYGLPWAVTYNHPATASIYRGIPVHPTQLYLATGNLLIFAVSMRLSRRPVFKGTLTWIYLFSYGLLRFVVEFYRGDVRPTAGVLTLDQVICIVFALVGGVMLARRFLPRGSRRPVTATPDHGMAAGS